MADESLLRAVEIGGATVYLLALYFSVRRRDPFYLGMFVACNLLVFWDWIFNTRWFFNVVFDERLFALWSIQGEHETFAALFAFVGFYYWVFHILMSREATLDRIMGVWQYPLIYIASAIYVLCFEVFFVNLGVWTYYQQDAYLLYGAAWSNAWMNSNIIVFCLLLLKAFRRWAQIGGVSGWSPRSESFWKSFVLSGSAISSGFFLAFALQMIWYIATQPWIESPRVF